MRKLDLLFVLLCAFFVCSCGTEGPDGHCKKYDDAVEIVVGSSNRIDSVQFFFLVPLFFVQKWLFDLLIFLDL